jgi:hypothetical protein
MNKMLEERRKSASAVEPAQPHAPRCIARFSSKAQMDIWLFCSGFPYSIYDWASRHEALHHRKPNADWLKVPEAIALDDNGQLNMEIFKQIIHGLSAAECAAGACRICWGTGWAYVIKGILFPETTGIPGQLISTHCWCRKKE